MYLRGGPNKKHEHPNLNFALIKLILCNDQMYILF